MLFFSPLPHTHFIFFFSSSSSSFSLYVCVPFSFSVPLTHILAPDSTLLHQCGAVYFSLSLPVLFLPHPLHSLETTPPPSPPASLNKERKKTTLLCQSISLLRSKSTKTPGAGLRPSLRSTSRRFPISGKKFEGERRREREREGGRVRG